LGWDVVLLWENLLEDMEMTLFYMLDLTTTDAARHSWQSFRMSLFFRHL
jgi:hypothetical protein